MSVEAVAETLAPSALEAILDAAIVTTERSGNEVDPAATPYLLDGTWQSLQDVASIAMRRRQVRAEDAVAWRKV